MFILSLKLKINFFTDFMINKMRKYDRIPVRDILRKT